MTPIEEGYLRFEFGPQWDHVEQWDNTKAFMVGIHGVEGVRALDIIALSTTLNECLLLEIKDFRDQNDETAAKTAKRRESSRQRSAAKARPNEAQTSGKLVEQVAQKVVGTVAGLVGAARAQDTSYARDFANFLAAHKREGIKVRVVLWVEGRPTSKGESARAKANLLALTQGLKRKVSWLTSRSIHVLSMASNEVIPDLRVIDGR
jgi:hypothetical protein